VPDAEQLARTLARGLPVRMRLTLTPRNTGTHHSGNVVAASGHGREVGEQRNRSKREPDLHETSVSVYRQRQRKTKGFPG